MQQNHYSTNDFNFCVSYTNPLMESVRSAVKNFTSSFTDSNDVSIAAGDTVKYGKLKLRAKQNIALFIEYDESDDIFYINKEDIRLHVFSHDRKTLPKDLKIQLAFLWRGYALEADEKMTKGAVKLKNNLKMYFEEI